MRSFRTVGLIIVLIFFAKTWAQSNLPFSNPELGYKVKVFEIEAESMGLDNRVREHDGLSSGNKIIRHKDYEELFSYFPNGKVAEIMTVKQDQLDGLRTVYNENGTVQQEVPYVKGKIHGIKKMYNENGKLVVETKYINGKREGNRIFYFKSYSDDNKKVYAIVPYKNDKIEGIVKRYEANADHYFLKYTASFKNGLPDGKWNTYEECYRPVKSADGDDRYVVWDVYKVQEENNLKGIRTGKHIFFRIDSSISKVVMYENNKALYEYLYNNAGELIFTNPYENGKRTGEHRYYWEDGTLSSVATYVKGLRQGKQTTYFKNGKIESTAQYVNDNIIGDYITYYENGQIEKKQTYGANRLKTGTEVYYFQSGYIREQNEYDSVGKQLIQTIFDISGKKFMLIQFHQSVMYKESFFDKAGNVYWENQFSNRKKIGLYKFFSHVGRKITQSFMDDDNNGYLFQYSDFGDKIIDSKYYLKGKIVSLNDFENLFTIINDIPVKK